jgi:hypothetical protein
VAGKAPEDAAKESKSAAWKPTIACWLKTNTQTSNRWLSEQLHLGAPAAFSRNLTQYRRQPPLPEETLRKRLTSISAT